MQDFTLSKWAFLISTVVYSSYSFAGFNVNPIVDSYENKNSPQPIVLVHGLAGAEHVKFLGKFSIYDYWGSTLTQLAEQSTPAIAVSISPLNSNEYRGEELIKHLQYIQTTYYRDDVKFNLVGHSQGGPTSRYALGVKPELVSSIATVGSPHRGSPFADQNIQEYEATGKLDISSMLPYSSLQSVLNFLQNIIYRHDFLSALHKIIIDGRLDENDIKTFNANTSFWVWGGEGVRKLPDEDYRRNSLNYINLLEGIRANSTKSMQDFNTLFPEGIPISAQCLKQTANPSDYNLPNTPDRYFIKGSDGNSYPIYMTSWTGKIDEVVNLFPNQAHDGTVSVCSSRLGNLKGIYNWKHREQSGTFSKYDESFSVSGWPWNWGWVQTPTKWATIPNPIDVLKDHANYLKKNNM